MTKAIVLLIEAIQGGGFFGLPPPPSFPSGGPQVPTKKFQVIAKGRKNVAGFEFFFPSKLNISSNETIKMAETMIFVPSRSITQSRGARG